MTPNAGYGLLAPIRYVCPTCRNVGMCWPRCQWCGAQIDESGVNQ